MRITDRERLKYGMQGKALIAAIDGGGTKTEYVLCDDTGSVLRRVRRGASNPYDMGLEAACAEIREGLSQLLSGALDTPLEGVFAGLSGGSTGGNDIPLLQFFQTTLPNARVKVHGDMIAAISSGILSGEGCALISGTGSCAFARYDGALYRAGGWGYLFDGAGGGYDLGCAVIRRALAARDGRVPRGPMVELLERQLGGGVTAYLQTYYDRGKRYIAGFAPIVFQAEEAGDPAALEELDRNAEYMADILEALMRQVDHCKPGACENPEISLTGGLFHRKESWEKRLTDRLRRPCRLIFTKAPAIFGAAAEACRISGRTVTPEFRDRFLQTL